MDFKKYGAIEMTTSQEDWLIIRECYVTSFRRYPLYKYMVPDESKRDAFLRAYLQANYEVTVGSGQGILLAIKVPADESSCHDNNNNNSQTKPKKMKVVGGVIFLPPSSSGCGWAIESDKPYWDAYEKHRLEKICQKGLERVKRYEAWENKHVSQKASASRIPLWNGLFCAISPEYASKGLGTAVYKEAIRLMSKYWLEQQQKLLKTKKIQQNDDGILNKFARSASLNQLHLFALLNHRAIPQIALLNKNHNSCDMSKQRGKSLNDASMVSPRLTAKDIMHSPSAPLVVAISHSDRAANFHQANGFQPVSRIPFYDEVEKVTPFYTHVLVLDPFATGRLRELTTCLQREENPQDKSSLEHLNDSMKIVHDPILIK